MYFTNKHRQKMILLLESKTTDRQSKDWDSFSKKLVENAIKKCGWNINQIEEIDYETDPMRRIYVQVESKSVMIRTWDIHESKTGKSVCCTYSVYEDNENQ